MNSHIDRQRGDLQGLLGLLARRAWLIVLGVVVCVGAAVGLSQLQEKRYDATASLLFRPLYLDAQLSGLPLQLPGDADRDAETNVRLVSAEDVRARAARTLGNGYTADSLAKQVTVAGEGQSNLVSVTAGATEAATAARIANAVARSYVDGRQRDIRDQIGRAEDEVRRQLEDDQTAAQRRTLRQNLQKLQLLRATATADAQLTQPATPPPGPSSPKPLRNAIIGGFAGILLGLVLVLVAEGLDKRVRRPEELSDALGLPLLAVVPESGGLEKQRGWQSHLEGPEVEAFKRLRANLKHYASPEEELGSVLVTSATASAGKTTVALHLAGAAAAAGASVLLIEADMRRPQLAGVLGVSDDVGLSTMLVGDGALRAEGVHKITTTEGLTDPSFNGNGAGSHVQVDFEVLVAGPRPANPSELLDGERMRELLDSAKEHFDFVVVDGPPPGIVSDAIPLMKQVDGVVVVSRLGRESRDAVRRLGDDMRRLDARPIGAVANFSRERKQSYYYEYA